MTLNESKALRFILNHLQQTGDSLVSREAANLLDAITQDEMIEASPSRPNFLLEEEAEEKAEERELEREE